MMRDNGNGRTVATQPARGGAAARFPRRGVEAGAPRGAAVGVARRCLRRSALAGVLLGAAVGAAAAQAPDRSVRPPLGPVPELRLPPVQEFTLSNGVRLLLMEKHDLPLVQVILEVRAGSVHDPADRVGLADITADMLDEGAGTRDALGIANAFEMLGARFTVRGGLHTASASLRVPRPRLDAALAIMRDVVLAPTFPPPELERLRLERLTALVRQHDDPAGIAATLAARTVYGPAHPYGRVGAEAALRAVTIPDVHAFYQQWWVPGHATLIVVGDLDAATARAAAERALGSWQQQERPTFTAPADAAQVQGRVIYLVDKPGAAQSVIRFARVGVRRSTEDYDALEVMNTILGGSFTSRLNQNLRETHGFAYGASSAFDYRPAAGPWFAVSAVQTSATGPALREFMNELRGIRAGIGADEVERARNYLALGYPAGFQSVAGIAARLSLLAQFELPLDYFNRYVERVLAVTHAAVERVARQYIDPDNVAIIVVGDRSLIEPQIRAQELGEIRFLEVTDVLGPVPDLE